MFRHQFYSALERARTFGGFLHDGDRIIISEPSIIAADVAKVVVHVYDSFSP